MPVKLKAIDEEGGQAILEDRGTWHLVSLDQNWTPVLLYGEREAARCCLNGLFESSEKEYDSLEAAAIDVRERWQGRTIGREEVPFDSVAHLCPRDLLHEYGLTRSARIQFLFSYRYKIAKYQVRVALVSLSELVTFALSRPTWSRMVVTVICLFGLPMFLHLSIPFRNASLYWAVIAGVILSCSYVLFSRDPDSEKSASQITQRLIGLITPWAGTMMTLCLGYVLVRSNLIVHNFSGGDYVKGLLTPQARVLIESRGMSELEVLRAFDYRGVYEPWSVMLVYVSLIGLWSAMWVLIGWILAQASTVAVCSLREERSKIKPQKYRSA